MAPRSTVRESDLLPFFHRPSATLAGAVICLLLVGVLAAALLARPDTAQAQDGCTVDIRAG